MATCSTCKIDKTDEDFNWKVKDVKRSSVCKVCHKDYRREHYAANRDKYIAKANTWREAQGGHLGLRYNLTPDAFNELLSRFDGMCWLCRTKPGVVVDHDHSCCPTGYRGCGKCVRGVLCNGCNTGLGSLGDNVEGLEKAIAYLKMIR
jgi:hypothetical protein